MMAAAAARLGAGIGIHLVTCAKILADRVITLSHDREIDGGMRSVLTALDLLNAMLYSDNLHRAHRGAAALNVGTVWVNCFFIRDLHAPFGGVGAGREGGNFSREFFTGPKAIVMQIDTAK